MVKDNESWSITLYLVYFDVVFGVEFLLFAFGLLLLAHEFLELNCELLLCCWEDFARGLLFNFRLVYLHVQEFWNWIFLVKFRLNCQDQFWFFVAIFNSDGRPIFLFSFFLPKFFIDLFFSLIYFFHLFFIFDLYFLKIRILVKQ